MRLFRKKAKNSEINSQLLNQNVVEQVDSLFDNHHTVSLQNGVRFAKNSTNKMRKKILKENKVKENVTMSEKKMANTPVDEEQPEEKKPAKKPAAKKEKPGIGQRIKSWWKRNWKYVAAAGGGVAAGAGATYGVGKLGEHMANKRAAKVQQDVEID